MALNLSSQFSSDYELLIADDLLPLTQNRLVVYALGEKVVMAKGHGLQYTKVRFNRLPLPQAPLMEPTPNLGNTMQLSEVMVSVQQWGGMVVLSDVAQMVVKHDVLMKAKELISIQCAETLERNTFNTLFGFTQVNTTNSRGSRASLTTSDTPQIFDLQRAQAQLSNLGAYKWDGTEDVNPRIEATKQDSDGLSRKLPSPHFIVICHDFTAADFRMTGNFVQAASYSDVNKLYTSEVGQWAGDRVVATNMNPFFVGIAAVNGTAGSAGNLPTGNYVVQVTGMDPIRQYEQNIYQISGTVAVTGPNGSINVTLPSSAFLFNVYVSVAGSSTPVNLGASPNGPTVGLLQGMAAGLAGGQTVTITGVGIPQVPPAAPATGVTVYPWWTIGKYAYSQVVLDEIQIEVLTQADKSDPYNQLREVTWKVFYGTLLDNNLFCIRTESASGFTATYA